MASNKNVKIPHAMNPKGNKIIFRATEFDPKTDITISPLSEKAVQEYKGFQYTIFINNSYIKGSEFSKNVYIAVDKIPLIRNPMFGYSEKTTFYTSSEDPKRLAYTICIKEDDPNCVSLKHIFESLDEFLQSEEFKKICFKPFGYNEKTKELFSFEYNPIYKLPLTEEELAQQGENKKPYSEYGSVKIKFDVTTIDFKTKEVFEHPKINTMIFKIDETTKKPKKCIVNTVSDVENLVHKNGIINFIIRLQKCYCSKPAKKGRVTKITYGFTPVFEQITIHEPGDAFSSGGHNYIDMGDGELEEGEIVIESKINETNTINPTIPGKSVSKSAAKPKVNAKASKKINDEPTDSGEFDENEHISDDDDVQPTTGDSAEEEEEEIEEGGDEEIEEGGDEETEEGGDEEEEEVPEPEPPKKTTVVKKK